MISPPVQLGLIADSLEPKVDIVKPPGELVCFSAIATPGSVVTVSQGDFAMELSPQNNVKVLPANAAVLTNTTQIVSEQSGVYSACTRSAVSGKYTYTISQGNQTKQAQSKGKLTIKENFPTIVVTTDQAITRSDQGQTFPALRPYPRAPKPSSPVKKVTGSAWNMALGLNKKRQKRSIVLPRPAVSFAALVVATDRGRQKCFFP